MTSHCGFVDIVRWLSVFGLRRNRDNREGWERSGRIQLSAWGSRSGGTRTDHQGD